MSNLPIGWEKKTLNDISELTSSKRIYLSDYVEKGVPFFRGKEISQLKKNEKVEDILYITEEKYEEIKQKFGIPVKNDILITAVGTLANTYRIPNNDKFYFKDGNLIWLKNISEYSIYVEYSLNFNKKLLLDSAIGSSQKALTIAELKKIELAFPPLEEQKKIADILSTVDKKIAFVEENINATEELKKGLMQKLLTEGIGHTEFKDSELGRIPESWEVIKFEDCIIAKGQYGINAAAVDFSEDLPRYLRITDIDDSGKFIKENSKSVDTTEIDTFSLNENDIVFARTGNTTGKTYLYDKKDGELIFAGFLIRFTPNQDILDSRYLKLYTETSDYWKWVKVMSTRTGQPGINSNEYGKLPFKFPPLAEQKQIAEILSTVDNKLENLKEKKQSFEELKKGLMQKLLTGEVRV